MGGFVADADFLSEAEGVGGAHVDEAVIVGVVGRLLKIVVAALQHGCGAPPVPAERIGNLKSCRFGTTP